MGVFGCQFIVRLVQERSNLVAKWRRTNIAAGYNTRNVWVLVITDNTLLPDYGWWTATKNGVANRVTPAPIEAQITPKYALTLLIDVYTVQFYNILVQH